MEAEAREKRKEGREGGEGERGEESVVKLESLLLCKMTLV